MNYTFNMNSSYSTCLKFIVSFQGNHHTPLHYASKHEDGRSEVVQVLISHGANVDMKDYVSSIDNV